MFLNQVFAKGTNSREHCHRSRWQYLGRFKMQSSYSSTKSFSLSSFCSSSCSSGWFRPLMWFPVCALFFLLKMTISSTFFSSFFFIKFLQNIRRNWLHIVCHSPTVSTKVFDNNSIELTWLIRYNIVHH